MIDFLKKPWVIFLVAIPFFFCMNYYLGIRIDGALYTLQVIHRWFPERFVGDPPFMFGNQDSFTIFSPLYGFFMQYLPIDSAAMLITFGIQLLFAVAMILFIRAIAKFFSFEHLVLPITLTFFSLYISGSDRTYIFFSRLVEPYPVPRTLAVSFAILGLATLFHRNKWISPILTLVGSAFHPLMAGWILPIWLFFHFPRTRIPIVIISALFPLMGYIGVVPFASYPDGWYYRPLTYGPCLQYAVRFVMYITFMVVFYKKICKNERFNNFCFSVLIVISIAFYWYLWTGINNFILLYQLQVWRMEWLCVVIIFPLFFVAARESWNRCKETKKLTTKDMALLFFALSLFSDVHALDGFVIAIVLLCMPVRDVNEKICAILALCYSVLNILMSGYVDMFLLGTPYLDVLDYSTIDALHYRYNQLTSIMCVLFCGCMVKRKDWLRAFLFLIYPIFPQFIVLPIVAIVWPWLKKWQGIVVLAIAVLDGIERFSLYNSTTPFTFIEFFQVGSYVFVMFFLVGGCLLQKKKSAFGKVFVLLPVLVMAPYAALHWDKRVDEQKIEESNLDQFKWEEPFSQISERGKIFYYVSGYMCADSRLQFLTGSYVDTKSTVGEIFQEGHHKEAVGRLNALIYKNREDKSFSGVYMRGRIMASFFEDSLAVSFVLIDRVNFLCETGEITHLVSDFDELPYVKQDSVRMNVLNKEVYLYKCPLNLKEDATLNMNIRGDL